MERNIKVRNETFIDYFVRNETFIDYTLHYINLSINLSKTAYFFKRSCLMQDSIMLEWNVKPIDII